MAMALLVFAFSYPSIASPLSVFSQCLEKQLATSNKEVRAKKLPQAQALCRKQMSSTPAKHIELPAKTIDKLQIDAGFGWGIFSGSIYNANPDVTITKLVISMSPIHGQHMHHADMAHKPSEYVIDTNLPPASKSAISVALTKKDAPVHEFEWRITKVFGYKSP